MFHLFVNSFRPAQLILVVVFIAVSHGIAAASSLVSYQGRLTDSLGYPVPDSAYAVVFAVYADSVGGTPLWQESDTVETHSGLFEHLLGSGTAFQQALFRDNDHLFLQVTVDGGMVAPRTQLAEVPYALVAREARNEPGIAVSINTSVVPLSTGSMTDLVTVDITIPTDGYIVLHGKCYLLLSGTTGPNTAVVQIDENEGGGTSFPYYTIAGLGGYVNTQTSYFPVYVTRVYYKAAGTYTFRMEGNASHALPAEARSWDHVLTAIFYPTSYEGVKALTTHPVDFPGTVPLRFDDSAVSGRTGTYYEIDLRYYEQQSRGTQPNQIPEDSGKRD